MELLYLIVTGIVFGISIFQQFQIDSLKKVNKTLIGKIVESYIIQSVMIDEIDKKQNKPEFDKKTSNKEILKD